MPSFLNTDALAIDNPHAAQVRPQPPARLRSVHGRAQLLARIEAELVLCRRSECRLALMLLDTRARHDDGREPAAPPPGLWEAVALRLGRRIRSTDVALRLSQQRYAVLLHGAGRREAEVVRQTLTRALTERYELPEGAIGLDLAIGVGTYLDRRDSAGDLLVIAESQLPSR